MNAKPRIVGLGGGFGGLESLFYLKYKLGHRADLTLVSDQPKFLFEPNTIYIPFGEPPEKFEVDLTRPLSRQSIAFVSSRVENIDPANRSVITVDGTVDFDTFQPRETKT